ncbi:MAG: TetR/AcrR family transcriptional regulator [Ilumatobacteraceae bacterium]|nr:TetR/AcrR family transcriptional regulator [Ilumatobacteraceae bacterium]
MTTARPTRSPGRPSGGARVVDHNDILNAAEIVIRRDGAGVSLDAVAQQAGVTKPIVYDRVGGRAELANALAERLADRMVAAAAHSISGSNDRGDLATLIETSLTTVAQNRELFLYVTSGSTEQTAVSRLYLAQRSAMPLADALAKSRISQGLDPSVAVPWAYGIVGMLQMVSLWWISQEQESATQVATQIAELLAPGLGND